MLRNLLTHTGFNEEGFLRFMDFIPVPLLLAPTEQIHSFTPGPGTACPQGLGRKVYVNKAFLSQIGYTLDDISDLTTYFSLAYPDLAYREEQLTSWQQALHHSRIQQLQTAEVISLVNCKNGEQRWFAISSEVVSSLDPSWHMFAFRDVHDIKNQLAIADTLSKIDSLTELCNRREITRILYDTHMTSVEERTHFSLLMCDLDYFKQLNDQYGHEAGDLALRCVAEQLRQHLRHTDKVGRWGGEEFLVILQHTEQEEAKRIAERIRKAIAEIEFIYRDAILTLSISIGVASKTGPSQPTDSLVQLADENLYQAKKAGRNQIFAA